jgi:hypothetical protein
MYKFVSIKKASDGKHKYEVELLNVDTQRKKTIKFGAHGMNDYILYTKNDGKAVADVKKQLYIDRHAKREDWTKDGVATSGFWSRWVLWNKPTFDASLNDAKKHF